MKLLLIVGYANDIFIYNYAKWLKASMDVRIDIFEIFNSTEQSFDNKYYERVSSAKGYLLPLPKGKGLIDSIVRGRCLKKFLRGKQYDIIHSQWMLAPVVLQHGIKKHCNKLVITFWGGEFEKQNIFGSSGLYRCNLNRLSRKVDCIINSINSRDSILKNLPYYKGSFKHAVLGSAPLEALYELMQTESKIDAKNKLGIPIKKIVVLIGYSGKPIHRQIQIIKTLHDYPQLTDKIHILAPMTRGASKEFINRVDNELNESGFTYTLIKGRFLSDIEVARLRIATDVALQLSEWDGFSRSIVECLCAKSILVYGKWLGYENYMEQNGFEGIEVGGIEDAVSKLEGITNNIARFNEMTERNSNNGRHQAIWSECIADWVNAYQELLKD